MDLKQIIDKFKKAMCKNDIKKCPSDASLKTYAYSIAWLKKRLDFPEAIICCSTVSSALSFIMLPA